MKSYIIKEKKVNPQGYVIVPNCGDIICVKIINKLGRIGSEHI